MSAHRTPPAAAPAQTQSQAAPGAHDAPTERRLQAHGIGQALFEWRAGQRGQGPSLFMVHATGFHGRVWDQTIHHLPGRHVLAIELRGHGRSEAAPMRGWEDFAQDLAGAGRALGLQGAVGVGHSMGAAALVQAAALAPQCFSRLVLVDPVLRDPAEYHLPPPGPDELHPAAQRKNHFESADAMYQRFADRPPYAVFTRAALHDYCDHGLQPHPDGRPGFELACAPALEGRVYPTSRAFISVYASIRALQIPVWVLRARPQDPSVKPWDPLGSPTWPGLAAEFRQGRDLPLGDKTHFLPMEDPALMAQLITQALAEDGH